MIIFDTCILRGLGLDSSSAELLRAIRTSKAQKVGIPWIVLEELVAQQAVKYSEQHQAAVTALESLTSTTPWKLKSTLEALDPDRVRSHWRKRYGEVAETIPTSEKALRLAAFREANVLAPARKEAKNKTGYRDVAIWLSAVEYAEKHPHETVYFVSSNTKDFGDGTDYDNRPPMNEDVRELGDRFVHLISLDDVLNRFTEQTSVDEARAREVLSSEASLEFAGAEASRLMKLTEDSDLFEMSGLLPSAGSQLSSVRSAGWQMPPIATFAEARDIQAHKIGDQVWCTATARWLLAGIAELEGPGQSSTGFVACSWETRILFAPQGEPGLVVIKGLPPQSLTSDEAEQFSGTGIDAMSVIFLLALMAVYENAKRKPWPPTSSRHSRLEHLFRRELRRQGDPQG